MSRSAEKYAGKIIDNVVRAHGAGKPTLNYRQIRSLLEHAYDAGHKDLLRATREDRKEA